jgi:uncharacterized ParB-like nuclease family protein
LRLLFSNSQPKFLFVIFVTFCSNSLCFASVGCEGHKPSTVTNPNFSDAHPKPQSQISSVTFATFCSNSLCFASVGCERSQAVNRHKPEFVRRTSRNPNPKFFFVTFATFCSNSLCFASVGCERSQAVDRPTAQTGICQTHIRNPNPKFPLLPLLPSVQILFVLLL